MSVVLAEAIIKEISLPELVVNIQFLNKGYSNDRKFILYTQSETTYLLRISDVAEERVRRTDFELLSRLWESGAVCPKPICFDTKQELGVCFMVLTYLPGDCAEEVLPQLTSAQQYAIGLEAGKELGKIHHALPPLVPVDDYVIRSEKYDRYQRYVREANITFKGQAQAEQYAAHHLDLLRERPTTFRHGDYHPGNLIVKEQVFAGVVDFNRCDWGDPIDDFYKLAFFGAPVSDEYARGQIVGYFGGEPSDDFWRLYNLYLALVLPGDILWTQQHYPEYLNASLERIELITSTHDFERGEPPTWWRYPTTPSRS